MEKLTIRPIRPKPLMPTLVTMVEVFCDLILVLVLVLVLLGVGQC